MIWTVFTRPVRMLGVGINRDWDSRGKPTDLGLPTAPERIQFKLAVVYNCLHGTATSYLTDELRCSADSEARRRLRSTSSSTLTVRRTRLSAIGPFLLLLPVLGTVCLNTSCPHLLCLYSEDAWKISCTGIRFLELVTATFAVPAQWLSSFLDTTIVLVTYLLTYLLTREMATNTVRVCACVI